MEPLPGGEGVTFRRGDKVLKRVHDPDEAAWTQALLARLGATDGFRIPAPLPVADGSWVQDGWIAMEFVEGLRPAAPDWDLVIDAGLRFGAAAERVRDDGEAVLDRRTHRWAVADRVAWGDAEVALPSEAAEVAATLRVEGAAGERAFCHGDLAGNVHVDPDGVPVILDVSPYLRPQRWAEAVVVADALLWFDADAALVGRVDEDMLRRALLFRLVAEQLADDPRHHADLGPYRRVLTILR